jgi:GTPase SAR1 family protein
MGICASMSVEEQEERNRAKALDAKMAKASRRDQCVNKLLLLGAGESGKSTLFKQMVMIYGTAGETKTTSQLEQYRETLRSNAIVNAQALAEASEKFGKPITSEGKKALATIQELEEGESEMTAELGILFKNFWEDEGIQECYSKRHEYQLVSNAAYIFDNIERICNDDYVPNTQDILRARVRTTGIVEYDFAIDGNNFKMFDVGGQRNERKKWIHCFENVTAVMFVAAISEYNECLFEDETQNRMTEALTIFREISNSEWFKKTEFILFLNKKDLFIEKIKVFDITDSPCEELRSFDGDCRSFDETTAFLTKLFTDCNRKKQMYAHVTCATDSDNVKFVFDSVKDIIIQKSLEAAGLT